MHEARRIYRDFSTLLNPALSCLLRLGALTPADVALGATAKRAAQWVFQAVQLSASQAQARKQEAPIATAGGADPQPARLDARGACLGGITLLTQFFDPPDARAKAALLAALSRNLQNTAISKVVLFCELQSESGEAGTESTAGLRRKGGGFVTTPVDDVRLRRRVRDELLYHATTAPCDSALQRQGLGQGSGAASAQCGITAGNIEQAMRKVMLLPVSTRLHFSTAIDFANTYILDDANATEKVTGSTCVAIANSDIYFDETLGSLQRAWPLDHRNASSPTVLALSKWSVLEPGPEHAGGSRERLALSLRSDSQDAWIFRQPLVPVGRHVSSSSSERDPANPIVTHSHFPLGAPRCDNRLAEVLHSHGHTPLNTAMLVRAIEVGAPVEGVRATGSEEGRGRIYGQLGSVHGPGAFVPLSDLAA